MCITPLPPLPPVQELLDRSKAGEAYLTLANIAQSFFFYPFSYCAILETDGLKLIAFCSRTAPRMKEEVERVLLTLTHLEYLPTSSLDGKLQYS